MKNSTRNNRFLSLVALGVDFVRSALGGVWHMVRAMSGKSTQPLRPNQFLSAMDFLMKTGPRAYWQRPTALRAGRSIATLLRFIFERDQSFDKK